MRKDMAAAMMIAGSLPYSVPWVQNPFGGKKSAIFLSIPAVAPNDLLRDQSL